jgi:hypothetical protein
MSTTQATKDKEVNLLRAVRRIHAMLADQYECSDRQMCEQVMAVAEEALKTHWETA